MPCKASEIITLAQAEVGVREIYQNEVKYNTEYYGRVVNGPDYAWCQVFIWWLFRKAGAAELFFDGKKTAYCPAAQDWYKRSGLWISEGYRAGDVIFYDWNGNGQADHVGVVESVNADGSVNTIEGNRGDSVTRLRSVRPSAFMGGGRPRYEPEKSVSTPSEWAKEACERAVAAGVIEGSGGGEYNWQDPMSREELCVVLSRLNLI